MRRNCSVWRRSAVLDGFHIAEISILYPLENERCQQPIRSVSYVYQFNSRHALERVTNRAQKTRTILLNDKNIIWKGEIFVGHGKLLIHNTKNEV